MDITPPQYAIKQDIIRRTMPLREIADAVGVHVPKDLTDEVDSLLSMTVDEIQSCFGSVERFMAELVMAVARGRAPHAQA